MSASAGIRGVMPPGLGEFDVSTGTCAQPEYQRSGETRYWEEWTTARDSEVAYLMRTRAEQLCQQCPVLEACEQRLRLFESAGMPVHGIVAGRVYRPASSAGQSMSCAQCATELYPRPSRGEKRIPGRVYEQAMGMCARCYERMRRLGK